MQVPYESMAAISGGLKKIVLYTSNSFSITEVLMERANFTPRLIWENLESIVEFGD